MPLFGNREKAFEGMFARGEETRFRTLAKRNNALGRWAADQLGLTGDAARAYADKITRSTVAELIDENLVTEIDDDFRVGGVSGSRDQIRRKMSDLMLVAIEQMHSK